VKKPVRLPTVPASPCETRTFARTPGRRSHVTVTSVRCGSPGTARSVTWSCRASSTCCVRIQYAFTAPAPAPPPEAFMPPTTAPVNPKTITPPSSGCAPTVSRNWSS
jgi:hypothetical protein